MGDPTNPATAIGPLINQRAVDLVHAHVQEAIAAVRNWSAAGNTTTCLPSHHRYGCQTKHAPLHRPDVWSGRPNHCRQRRRGSPGRCQQLQIWTLLRHPHKRFQPCIGHRHATRNRHGAHRRPDSSTTNRKSHSAESKAVATVVLADRLPSMISPNCAGSMSSARREHSRKGPADFQ